MPYVEIDRKILTECLSREPGAWERFVDRFIGVFVHVIQHTAHARSVKVSQDDIEDLCSEIFVTLLKNDFAVLRHFKGRSALATYLTVIARRIVIKSITQRKKSEAMGHVSAHQSALAAAGTSEPLQRAAMAEEIQRLLGTLSPTVAAVVSLHHLEGKSYGEIAQMLKIPVNSIGPTLTRARESMRQVGLQIS